MEKEGERPRLDQARLRESGVSTVFIDGAQCLRGQLDLYELVQFGNPDTFRVQVGSHQTLVHLGDVASDPAFFLRQTRTVDFSTHADFGPSDAANSRHKMIPVLRGGERKAFAD